MLLPLEVTYDDHTADIAENRILRAALRRLLGLNRVRGSVRQRLAHLERKLDGVGDLRAVTALPSWQETRSKARYVPALRPAEIILRLSVAETAVGGIRVAPFVVNMATVFEGFVEIALGEAVTRLGIPGGRERQYKTRLDHPGEGTGQGRIRMKIDVVYRASGTPPVVFDAKYKASSAGGNYANADHYQMLAYCTALGAPRAWLVYAGAGEHRSRRIVNTGVAVEEYPLDLSQHPDEVLARVSRLAALSVMPFSEFGGPVR